MHFNFNFFLFIIIDVRNFFAQLKIPSLADYMVKHAVTLKAMLAWKEPSKRLQQLGIFQAGLVSRIVDALKEEKKSK